MFDVIKKKKNDEDVEINFTKKNLPRFKCPFNRFFFFFFTAYLFLLATGN